MSDASFHQRHAGLLRFLTDDEAMDRLLNEVTNEHDWSTARAWTRVWGRVLDPGTGRTRLLYQANDQPAVDGAAVLCTLDIGGPEAEDVTIIDPDLGPVVAQLFPDDHRLPTLPAVLSRYPDARVVRYRPGKRCTLRRTTTGDYLKVFPDERADRLQAEGEELWRFAAGGDLGFSVARPLGFDSELLSYSQAEVSGASIVSDLFQPGGDALAARLGEATATIATSGLRPTGRHDSIVEMKRTRLRAGQILAFVPSLAAPIASFLELVERSHIRLDPAPLHPIHGSPHPNQWVVDGSSLGLVDFDRFSFGDPELDVATFTAEVDFEAAETRHEVTAAFEHGYRRHYGDLDRGRLNLYRAHKRLAKVHRTVSAIRVDGDVRAAAHLDAAAEALSGSCHPSGTVG